MKIALAAAFTTVLAIAGPAVAQMERPSGAPGALSTARDLYTSARYDEALAVLNSLRVGDAADRKAVEQYRSLCLLALGRASEAETAIAAVVTADPTYQPDEADASPRVRATFTDVRRRLLPEIATARYKTAKLTYDRGEWATAEKQFQLVLELLDDRDMGGRLPDLRVLAAGFRELSARAAEPPPDPKPESKPDPPPAPVRSAVPPASPAPTAPVPGKVYGADDANVTVPVVVKQAIPAVPQNLVALARTRGLLEVVIDEQGRVISMAIRSSIHPNYDSQLLAAARDWKYQPAKVNGQPVKFRRLIQVTVKK